MSGEFRRHVRLVGAQLRLGVLDALAYRVGFWTEGVLGLGWAIMGVAPLMVAFGHRDAVVGWTFWPLMVLTGFYIVISGVFGALLQPALLESMNHIRRGTLDYVLLRPVDALVACLASRFSPWRLLEVLAGIVLIVGALIRHQHVPSAAQVAGCVAIGALGLLALYAIGVLVLCLSFRAMQLQNLTFLFEASMDFARWPVTVFHGPLRALFTFVVPFALMTTFPAQALLEGIGARELALASASTITLVVLARLWWSQSLRAYASASS